MNKRNKVRTLLCVLLAVTVLTAFGASTAGGAGSQSDPLVTLSYLTDTFTGQILDKVDALLSQRNAALSKELSDELAQRPGDEAQDLYTLVTLSAGQTLSGEAGCEILLRSGTASCAGLLVNMTSGDLEDAPALAENHLYLMPEARSITTPDGAALLARGSYTVT